MKCFKHAQNWNNLVTALFFLAAPCAWAQMNIQEKGLLPEIQQVSEDTLADDQKSLASEVLISNSEGKAIDSLNRILNKKRGTPQEPDLLFRLAELQMRRSRSGRYFDLQRNSQQIQIAMSHLKWVPPSGASHIQEAIKIYGEIQRRFPHYREIDAVYFSNAFAHQQTNKETRSLDLYQKLITEFPRSRFLAEAHMGRGEILYAQGKFAEALKNFLALRSHKNSKAYIYGMYKAAWSYYNLKEPENAVNQLLLVLEGENQKYSMRRETIKDLVLFTSDFYKVDQIYSFFKKNVQADELELAVLDFAQLYFSHSRHQELNSLMEMFLKEFPHSPIAVRLQIYFAKNFETLKKRESVISHVSEAHDLCAEGSPWTTKMIRDIFVDSCLSQLKSFQMELISKWWEIWEKNKNHAEFNKLLTSLLKTSLKNEGLFEVDKKTRYLLAELHLNRKNFLEASEEYQKVAENSQNTKLRHDSYYSALFSFEKYLQETPQIAKDLSNQDRTFFLAEQYLKFSPAGKHADDVRLKLAMTLLAKKNYEQADSYLNPLLDSKDPEVRAQAQDVKLEILNIQEKFSALKELSSLWAKKSLSPDRRKNLEKIAKEAEFNEIVRGSEDDEKILAYARDNVEGALGREALWKLLSKSFSSRREKESILYGEEFIKNFPLDPETDNVKKDLLAIYIEYGFFQKAASLLGKSKSLSLEQQEKQGDFYQLENNWNLAHQAYAPLIDKYKIGSKDYFRIFDKISQLARRDSSIQTERLLQQLVTRGIEPFATRAQIEQAKRHLNEGKYAAAFETARRINSRAISSEEKFSSRMIQAEILEREFTSQSLKAPDERFYLVFGLKTEKFEKAFTAYSDALKLTSESEKQRLALIGIHRIFEHFIFSLENLPQPRSMDPQEKQKLRQEITELLPPLKQRQSENQEKIASLNGSLRKENGEVQSISFLTDPQRMKEWPLWISEDAKFKSLTLRNGTAKSFKSEKVFDDLGKDQLRDWNLYRLAVLAYQEDKFDKAHYLLSKIQSPTPAQAYLRGSLFLKEGQPAAAAREFEPLIDRDFNIDELKILTSFQSFARKDYLTVIEKLESIKNIPLTDLHLLPVYVDSLVGAGFMERAEKFLKKSASNESKAEIKERILSHLTTLQTHSRSLSSTSEVK